ncbi:c6 transcription [Pyrenophora tritici-repentis]|nr:c6 transcription [Pyrenophora tritici-repentis]
MSVERRPSQQSSIGPGQTHGSSSNGPSSGSPTPNPRSCVTCRRRKVKCDKKNPCSNCVRAKIECVFPGPGRAPRKSRKPADAELLERLRRLEDVVTSLNAQVEGHEQEAADRERSRQNSTVDDPCPYAQSSSGGGESRAHAQVAVDNSVEGLENRFGRLVVEKGRSRYINNSFWASLNNEVEDLKAILIEHSDDEDDAHSPDTSNLSSQHHGFIFGYSSSSVDMQALHPGQQQARDFWEVYKENVESLVKVLHIPTHEPIILDAFTHLDKVDRGLEALLFAIYYGAATSSTPEDCLARWGEDRGVLLNRYRFGLEQALARANFLYCDEVIILQAFVVFMVLLRRNDDARKIWTLTGLVVRISQTLGIHRDGSHFGLPPFQVEMRRRLWWQVCILDARSSEDHGCDPNIVEAQFDTKMPLNVNDTDLYPDMTEFPEERQGFTDMTFCLLRFEIANIFRRIIYVPPGPNKCTEFFAGLTIEQKEKWITECHQAMEAKYLKNCDMNIPICWVTATISRLIMSKMWLIIYHPHQRKDGGITLPQETKDKLFITSLENVEYSLLLETEARTMKWGWLFRTYIQWHAIAFLLSELCVRTKGEAVERAWRALEATAGHWWFPLNDSLQMGKGQQGCLWKPLRKLLAKAKAAREREMALERASIAIRNAQFRNDQRSFEFPEAMAPKTLSSVTSQHLDAAALDSLLRPAASKLGEVPFTQHPSWPNSPTESRPGVALSSQNSNGMSNQRKLPDVAPNKFSNDNYILNNDPVRHFGDLLDFGLDNLLTEVMGSGATTGPDTELEYAAAKSSAENTNYHPISRAMPPQTIASGYPTFGDGMLPVTNMDFRMETNANNGLEQIDLNGNTNEAAMMDNGDMDWTLWDDMVNQYGTTGHKTNSASTSSAATLGLVHWF